jgi:predicted dehydrogenase
MTDAISHPACRWGVLSTAFIGRKIWQGLSCAGNARLVAVASRRQAVAQDFIDSCQATSPWSTPPVAIDGYQQLLDRPDIDAVYIPLPTGLRTEWVLKAIAAGKHVLAEKPSAADAGQLRQILAAAEQQRVQYMDNVMFMHSARLPLLRQVLDDTDRIGQLRHLTTQFSFCGDSGFRTSNIRVDASLEPYGCLGDLGWYCVRFLLWVLKYQRPLEVRGRVLTSLQGSFSSASVPGEFSAELLFPDGISASLYCSFVTGMQQLARVSGTGGYVQLDDFVLPYHASELSFKLSQPSFLEDGCDRIMEQHDRRYAVREFGSGRPESQESLLLRRFSQLVTSRQLEPHWGQISLATQIVLDALWTSSQADAEPVTIKAEGYPAPQAD